MAQACFYCGGEASELEYGIPPWVPGLLGLEGSRIDHLETRAEPRPRREEIAEPADQLPYSLPSHPELADAQPVERLQRAIDDAIDEQSALSVDEYTRTSLCPACAAIVGAIDVEARPLLTRLIEGEAVRLSLEEQRVLATWAARAAYAVLAVERKTTGAPRAHRLAIRNDGRPHENVFIGIGRYRHAHVGVLAARQHTALDSDGRTVEAYNVLLVLGHLATKVFGVHRRPEGTRVKPPEGEMVRLWPAQNDPVSWPPIWGLSPETLEHAFLYEPFFRPFRYSEVTYLGPGKKIKAKRKRTEGLRGRT